MADSQVLKIEHQYGCTTHPQWFRYLVRDQTAGRESDQSFSLVTLWAFILPAYGMSLIAH